MKEFKEIRTIDIKSTAKVSIFLGFAMGLVFALYSLIWSFFVQQPDGTQIFLTYNGFLGNLKSPRHIFLIIFPFVSSFGFLVWGSIFALIYNFVAKRFGGLKIYFDNLKENEMKNS